MHSTKTLAKRDSQMEALTHLNEATLQSWITQLPPGMLDELPVEIQAALVAGKGGEGGGKLSCQCMLWIYRSTNITSYIIYTFLHSLYAVFYQSSPNVSLITLFLSTQTMHDSLSPLIK